MMNEQIQPELKIVSFVNLPHSNQRAACAQNSGLWFNIWKLLKAGQQINTKETEPVSEVAQSGKKEGGKYEFKTCTAAASVVSSLVRAASLCCPVSVL